MREDLRRQYLKALGVPCLVPRFILPGAAASRRCEMPLALQSASAASVAPALRSGPAPAAAASSALREALADSPTQRRGQAPESGTSPGEPAVAPRRPAPEGALERTLDHRQADRAATSRSAAVRFSLTLCRGGGWLVIDEGPAPTPGYQALLTNLLHAGGHSATVQGEDFHWPPPLHRPMQIDLSIAAAGQVLVGRLQTLHQRQPLSRLLLLGQRPQQLLAEWSAEEGMQRLDLSISLWQALTEPAVKRQLWLQLVAADWL